MPDGMAFVVKEVESGPSDLDPHLNTVYLSVDNPYVDRIFCHVYGSASKMSGELTVGKLREMFQSVTTR